MAEPLSLHSFRVDGYRIVGVDVELDLATAPKLAHFLAEENGTDVVLDLRDLAFVDSTGIHVIVAAHNRLESEGRRLTLRWVHGVPFRAIQILGLDTVLHLDGTLRG